MSQQTSRATRKTPSLPLRQGWCLLAILVVLLGGVGTAHAEVPITTQAVADKGAFLPYTPPPAKPASVCLIDTGVNVNPDTESIVLYRTAIDGGNGNDVSPTLHGTVLAMMAAAPLNGWGMVGTAPTSTRIVSVRILEQGQDTFPFSSYAAGISICLELRKQYNIKVINLSLGSPETPSSQDYETLGGAIERAEDYGVAVVASAGNDDGGPVEYPAAYPGVLSVGATDTQTGAFCSFSNRGASLRMLAPGCDLDGADPETGIDNYNRPQGTSESADIDADALAALEGYAPELTPQTAEAYLSEADKGTLDITQAFRDVGLEAVVAAGEAGEPQPSPEPSLEPPTHDTPPSGITSPEAPLQETAPSSPMTLIAAFQRPRARLKPTEDGTILSVAGRPSEARTEARYFGHRHSTQRLRLLRVLTGVFSSVHVPRSVAEVAVRYTDPYDAQRDSPWTTLLLTAVRARARNEASRQ
jgi:hypothetical protein